MSETIDEITAHVYRAIKELQAACPDSGFIVIGMTEFEGQTGVSLASNVNDATRDETLMSIAEGRGEAIFPIFTSGMVN